MRILFLGPPNAGKGTQATRLSEYLELPHIATGDMYRHHVAVGDGLGEKAKPYMERGDLVPDDVTNQMARERLLQPDVKRGFVLDGYPRNLVQAEFLDSVMKELKTRLDRVLKFRITGEVLIARSSGRRLCPTCKTVYHMEVRPPANDEVCDNEGTPLLRRKDDEPEAIRNRLEVYGKDTKPLYDLYNEKGLLVEIDAIGSTEDVFARVLEAIR